MEWEGQNENLPEHCSERLQVQPHKKCLEIMLISSGHLENWKRAAHYEKDGDVRLGWAVVEVDAANDNHTDRDHHGDAAGDGAPDGAQQQEDDLHYEVDHISRCLVRVSDSSKQRIVGRRFSWE